VLRVENLVKTFDGEQRAAPSKRVPTRTGCSRQRHQFRRAQGESVHAPRPVRLGKTTTLRSIAGLEHPDSVKIEVRTEAACCSRAAPGTNRAVCRPTSANSAWCSSSYGDLATHVRVQQRRVSPYRS